VGRLRQNERIDSREGGDDTGRVFEELSGGSLAAPDGDRTARGTERRFARRDRWAILAAMVGSGLVGFVLGRVL
jgi:hypothetical protein